MFIEIARAAGEMAQVAEEAVHEVTQQPDVLGSLGINLKLFIAQLVNFAIILLVLWRWAYKPLLKVLNDRKAKIEQSLEDAEKAKTSLQMAEESYKKKVDEAIAKANDVAANAQAEADKTVADAKDQAKVEVEKIVVQARAQIAGDKENMQKEIKEEVVGVVFQLAEKVLGEKFDKEKDADFVKKLMK